MIPTPTKKSVADSKIQSAGKKERLANALRDNLRRRKAPAQPSKST